VTTGQIRTQCQDNEQFCKFGRLELKETDLDPAHGAIGSVTFQFDKQQHRNIEPVEGSGKPQIEVIVQSGGYDQSQCAQGDEDQLFFVKGGRHISTRRTVDDQYADEGEQVDQQQERPVE